jgi:hypothetical protein
MSSKVNAEAMAADPTNDLLWRFDMRRLSAEEIRDSILLVTGQLNRKMYGPSFYPRLTQEVLSTQSRPGDGWGRSSRNEAARRSVYMFIKRSLLSPFHTAFDFPDVDTSCEARFVTVQPGQSLAMLNSDFTNGAAARLADRVMADVGNDSRRQVARAIELTLNRTADDDELVEGIAVMSHLQEQHQLSSREALDQWCLIVLNLSEFVYLD